MGGEGLEGVQAGAGWAHVSSCEPSGSKRPLAAPSALRMRPCPADHPPADPLLPLTSPNFPRLPPGSCPNPDPAGACRPLGMGGCTRQTLRTFQNCLLVSVTAGFPRRAASCRIWRGPAGLRLPLARLSFRAPSDKGGTPQEDSAWPGEGAQRPAGRPSRHRRGGARCGFRERLAVCWGLSLSSLQASGVCPRGQRQPVGLQGVAPACSAHPRGRPSCPRAFALAVPSPEPSPWAPASLCLLVLSWGPLLRVCWGASTPPCSPPRPRLSCLQARRQLVGLCVCAAHGTQSRDSCLVLGCDPVLRADLAHGGVVPAPRKSLVLALGAGGA